jgi:hypothetical protein
LREEFLACARRGDAFDDQLLPGVSKRTNLQLSVPERDQEWHGNHCQTEQHQSA